MTLSREKSADDTASSSGTSAVLRQLNSTSVLEAIKRSDDALRVAEIARVTGLSRPTVETVAEGLLAQGWVAVDDSEGTGEGRRPGRPARRYRFNAAVGHVVGVDIGAHSIAAVVSDLNGTTVASLRRRVVPMTPGEDRLRITSALITDLLADARVTPGNVLAMTVGTPGTVSPREARVGKSPGMPGWPDLDLIAALRQTVSCPIDLENDANLAAVGERARGVAQDSSDVLFLLLGERLGAGVITNGHLVRGRDGASGELGYVSVPGAQRRAPEYGPLESRVNASALVELGQEVMAQRADSQLAHLCGGDPALLTAAAITRAAGAGDPSATRVLRTIVRILAQGIGPALLTLNPELLVIGGGISRAGIVLRDMVAAQVADLGLYAPEVRISALGDEAVLVGAVDQSIRVVEDTVLSRVSA